MKIALCLLTLDELVGCMHDIPNLPLDQFDEVFALDGGSTDGTLEYLSNSKIIIHNQKKKGYNNAYIEAVEHINSDAIVFFHPKGSINPSEVLKFREYFEKGYDIIIASRIIDGGKNEEDEKLFKPRKWFVIGLSIISALLWKREGKIIWDVLHGFRGFTVKAFKDFHLFDYGVTADLEMVVQSYKAEMKRLEFPTKERMRVDGKTHFKALPTGIKILRYLWNELTHNLKKPTKL